MAYNTNTTLSVTLDEYCLSAYFSVVSDSTGAVNGYIQNISIETTSGEKLSTLPLGYSYGASLSGTDGILAEIDSNIGYNSSTLYPSFTSASFTAYLCIYYNDYASTTRKADNSQQLTVDVESSFIPYYVISTEVTRQPYKVEYHVGECFDISGLEYTVTYSDGSSKVYTPDNYSFYVYNGEDVQPFTETGNVSVGINFYDASVETGESSFNFTIDVQVKEATIIWILQEDGTYQKAIKLWVYDTNTNQYTDSINISKIHD